MMAIRRDRYRCCQIFWSPFLAFLLGLSLTWPARGEVRLLGDVSHAVPDTLTLSPDGKRFAVVTVDGRTKARRVIVDGKPLGKFYDSIAQGMPIFSVNGRGVAFVAKLGPKCHVIRDGFESEGYPLVRDGWPIADLVFSPHGKYLAYKARVEGQTMQVVQGENFGPYEVAVDNQGNRLWGVWDFCFSPDGESFAYRAKMKDKMVFCTGTVLAPSLAKEKGGVNGRLSFGLPCDSIGRGTPMPVPGHGASAFAYIISLGGKEFLSLWNGREIPQGKTYDAIARGSIRIPPHNPHGLDYVARNGNQWVAVAADKEGPPYDEISPLMYAPDGRHAYAARKGKAIHLVVQEVEGPPFEGIRYPGTVFSPDGQTIAYAARTAGTSLVVVNGKESARHGLVDGDSLTFSPNSKRLAYVAAKAGKRWVVLDGQAGPEFEEVSRPRFGPDSSRLGYRGRQGLDHYVVIDGEKHGPYGEVTPDSPVFSGDGKHVAYGVLQKGQWNVLLDGKVLGPASEGILSQLSFSRDGPHHLVYVGKYVDKGRVTCALVIDGKPGRFYDALWMGEGGRLFLDSGGLEYFAKKGLLVYRVTESWSK